MRSIWWFLPAVLVFIGILLLSTVLSVPIQVEGVGYTDKLSHAFAYMVLVSSLLFGFDRNKHLSGRRWLFLILLCSAYGVLLEWIQYTFFPNRYFEWLDATANVTGVLIGSLFFMIFRKWLNNIFTT